MGRINIAKLSTLGIVLVTLIWGSAFVVIKDTLDILPPLYILALRFGIAGLVLLILGLKFLKKTSKSEVTLGAILGVFLFLAYALQTYGLKYTTISNNAFITSTYIVFIPIVNALLKRQKLKKQYILSIIICFVGILLLTVDTNLKLYKGDLLTLLCSVFFTVYFIMIDYTSKKYSAYNLSVYQFITCALLSLIFTTSIEGTNVIAISQFLLDKVVLYRVIYLAIMSTMLCYLILQVCQKYTDIKYVTILLALEAVFGMVFEVLFYNTAITVKLISGCILIFVSIIVSEYKFKPRN
ncbi:DMT family transporter [Anaerosporobacter sp.]